MPQTTQAAVAAHMADGKDDNALMDGTGGMGHEDRTGRKNSMLRMDGIGRTDDGWYGQR